jgi:hypothetical protein
VLVVGLEALPDANGVMSRPKRLLPCPVEVGWENKLADPDAPKTFDGAAEVCDCEPAKEKMGAVVAAGAACCWDGAKAVKEGVPTPFAVALGWGLAKGLLDICGVLKLKPLKVEPLPLPNPPKDALGEPLPISDVPFVGGKLCAVAPNGVVCGCPPND